MLTGRNHPNRRPATVLVMVVGVLAMLFIIGSTLLVVSRFERQTIENKTLATDRGVGTESLVDSILRQLRLELVGYDGIPYNLGWNALGVPSSGDSFIGEKYATFPGFLASTAPFGPQQTPLRAGNLLLASNEPYDDGNGNWRYSFTSSEWLFTASGLPLFGTLTIPQGATSSPEWGQPSLNGPAVTNVGPGGPVPIFVDVGDADGDGVPDTPDSIGSQGFRKYMRIISHGGMVLLDPQTHPSLLAQVIHPRDLPASVTGAANQLAKIQALRNYIAGMLIDPPEHERSLRRRGLLPENIDPSEFANLPVWPADLVGDMRRMLPFTLGYDANTPYGAAATDWTPHWWQVNPTERDATSSPPGDHVWWKDRMNKSVNGLPPLARTDTAYDANNDNYDRRHLLTTTSADNVLRPQRDENRLKDVKDVASGLSFYDLIASPASSGPSPNLVAYGTIPLNALPTWKPEFNRQGSLTQFSLRDVLRNWPIIPGAGGPPDFMRDAAGNPIASAQPTYRKLLQLTAYYLAVMQHTSMPGSSNTTVTPVELGEQLRAAAQLAVNTVDFADADDTPTHFAWTGLDAGGNLLTFEVTGVERHPYITEAYCRIVQKPDPVNPTEWDPAIDPLESIYAVELYNPYDVPIDLSDYAVGPTRAKFFKSPAERFFLAPYSYVVLTNRIVIGGAPWLNATDGSGNPIAVPNVNILENPTLTFNYELEQDANIPAFRSAVRIDLVRNGDPSVPRPGVLEVTLGGTVDEWVVDSIFPLGDSMSLPDGVLVNGIEPWLAAKPKTWARPRMWEVPPGDPREQYANRYFDDTDARNILPCKASEDWALPPMTGPFFDIRHPTAATDRLVRDYSLQRCKEPTNGRPPQHWYFTLSRQMMFPARVDYVPHSGTCSGINTGSRIVDDATAPAQHSLLGTDAQLNQAMVRDEFLGFLIDRPSTDNSVAFIRPAKPALAGFPVALSRALPESRHPVAVGETYSWTIYLQEPASAVGVVFDVNPPLILPVLGTELVIAADNGAVVTPVTGGYVVGALTDRATIREIRIDYVPTAAQAGFKVTSLVNPATNLPIATLSLPTTSSLALVTRYAHTDWPASVAAASKPPGSPRALIGFNVINEAQMGALQQIDNGHLPLFDAFQRCSDLETNTTVAPSNNGAPQTQFDIPWGQLVFNYFTALPLEELYAYRDLSVAPFGFTPTANYKNVRLVDLDPQRYNVAYNILFPALPAVEPVAGPNGPLVGPRVRGRININTAPWWVLDGLPMLPWDMVPSKEAVWFDGAYGDRFDPPIFGNYDSRVGMMLATETADESAGVRNTLNTDFAWNNRYLGPPLDLPSVSPGFARVMVAQRERRTPVDNVSLAAVPLAPGFLSIGQIPALLGNWKLAYEQLNDGPSYTPIADQQVLWDWVGNQPGIRDHFYTDTSVSPAVLVKPYAYLGYLQLVTPLVRLQDWATVKDHVFTIYITQQDPDGGPSDVWTHTELTVDRTRCLYTNDLPAIVSQTPPINYYNVVNDQ